MVQCQNTASCPGAFYTLHDVTSQDFRVGLRWLLPAGGFGFGGFAAQPAFAPAAQYVPAPAPQYVPAPPRNTCRPRRRNTCNRRCRAAADSGAAVPGRTDCMNRMKERAMRWVSAILLILLLILGMASPALAAARRAIQLKLHNFLPAPRWCPSICPSRNRRPWAGLVGILGLSAGLLTPAVAADYGIPVLRGSEPPAPVLSVGPATFTRWSGFYVGGNISLGSATSDFSTATRPLVQFSLQHTTAKQMTILQIFRFSAEEALLQPAAAPFSDIIPNGRTSSSVLRRPTRTRT